MLNKQDYLRIREEVLSSKKPYFLFHGDPDGFCSFLLLYKMIERGKGEAIKADPRITKSFAQRVKESGADKVFVLDVALVDQEFIDEVEIPVIWVDHHPPVERKNVLYFNPRSDGNDNVPVTYICYNVSQENLWFAAIGTIGDYFVPNYMHEFIAKYPKYLTEEDLSSPNRILFQTELGKLIRLFTFFLKGKKEDYQKCMKILTRVESPDEIMHGTTSRGRFLKKYAERLAKIYEKLKEDALSKATKNNIFLYVYTHDKMSFSGELAHELIYEYPDKVIIIARHNNGRYKCSFRSAKYDLNLILGKSLEGLDGTGGGHEHACGANISENDFPEFLKRLEKQL